MAQTVVPSTDKKNPAHRVHLQFTSNAAKDAHWNSEAGVSAVWIDGKQHALSPPGGRASATGNETRTVEFEFGATASTPIKASAFYYVCEGIDGSWQYLRRDFEIVLSP